MLKVVPRRAPAAGSHPARNAACAASLAAAMLSLAGCQPAATPPASPPPPVVSTPTPRQIQQQQARALAKQEASAREILDEIPPPLKRRYLSVHTADGWANPFLSVHRDAVTLRVIFPQQLSSPVDGGTMLQPTAARRQELEVRLADLPEALAAVPDFAWPYGRVVAVEESPAAARQDRLQVRRNVEQTIQELNDLGVVVNEWTTPGSGGPVH